MEYFAKFELLQEELFRFDTRIYLDHFDPDQESVCVGAIVGKNPGSACPRELNRLSRLELNNDKMLPTVGNRFREGFNRACKPLPYNAFVRVWNLLYVCNPNLGYALSVAKKLKELPRCASEEQTVPIIWYGWGGSDADLNPYKSRFTERLYGFQFFYNHRSKVIVESAPSSSDFAKHTQGMPAEPVLEYLSRVL